MTDFQAQTDAARKRAKDLKPGPLQTISPFSDQFVAAFSADHRTSSLTATKLNDREAELQDTTGLPILKVCLAQYSSKEISFAPYFSGVLYDSGGDPLLSVYRKFLNFDKNFFVGDINGPTLVWAENSEDLAGELSWVRHVDFHFAARRNVIRCEVNSLIEETIPRLATLTAFNEWLSENGGLEAFGYTEKPPSTLPGGFAAAESAIIESTTKKQNKSSSAPLPLRSNSWIRWPLRIALFALCVWALFFFGIVK